MCKSEISSPFVIPVPSPMYKLRYIRIVREKKSVLETLLLILI